MALPQPHDVSMYLISDLRPRTAGQSCPCSVPFVVACQAPRNPGTEKPGSLWLACYLPDVCGWGISPPEKASTPHTLRGSLVPARQAERRLRPVSSLSSTLRSPPQLCAPARKLLRSTEPRSLFLDGRQQEALNALAAPQCTHLVGNARPADDGRSSRSPPNRPRPVNRVECLIFQALRMLLSTAHQTFPNFLFW